jgi:hypothetical protein
MTSAVAKDFTPHHLASTLFYYREWDCAMGTNWQRGPSAIFDAGIDLDQLRQRLRRMSDDELLQFGKAAKYMCSPEANMGKPPRDVFVVQLKEARLEWRRRYPKP